MISRNLKMFVLLLFIVSLFGSAGDVALIHALPVTLPAGVSAQDWAQIEALLSPVQQAYIKASNPGTSNLTGDGFGWSVAISGDTLVVGAPDEDSNATGINGVQNNNSETDSGAVYVFLRTGGVWSQQAYIKASNTEKGDNFGFSVAISEDTLVVGARYEDSNASGVNGNQTNNSTSSSGAVYVFTRTNDSWSQQAYLKASNPGISDYFGWSVSISGDTIVVGAEGESSNAVGVNGDQGNNGASLSGAAYVFTRSGNVWSQQAYLKASNTESLDGFGGSVAVYGDTIVVGAASEDSNATGVNGNGANNSALYSGAAYVFTRSGNTWSQQAYLKSSNTDGSVSGGDSFGYSVSIYGDTVVVGARNEDSNATGINGNQTDNSASNSGAVYVFVRSGSIWNQQAYLKASNTGSNDFFGWSVSIFEDKIVVGAEYEKSNATGVNGDQNNDSMAFSGAAYLFTRTGNVWNQASYLKASNTGISDNFGYSVAIFDDTIVSGAIGESSNASGVNGDQSNNLLARSGAAYTFYLPPTASFSDVPLDYWAWQYIESIYSAGITGGCSTNPLNYCPTNSVTRAQMAVFLLKAIHGPSFSPPAVGGSTGFNDVSTGYWAAAWVKQLAAEGITGGCGNGNYCPENTVTRDQMAVFLLKAKYGSSYVPPSVGSGTGFSDVPNDYWAATWIKQLASEAITGGCASGVYCPGSPVTRDQMAVFLQRTFNLTLP